MINDLMDDYTYERLENGRTAVRRTADGKIVGAGNTMSQACQIINELRSRDVARNYRRRFPDAVRRMTDAEIRGATVPAPPAQYAAAWQQELLRAEASRRGL